MRPFFFLAGVLLCASPALAFHEIESFDRSANTGGANGYYYTGSPRFKGYDCNICHVGAEERISVELGGDLGSGRYEPGLIYRIDVRLVGEHKGLESAFNPNTFTAEVTDSRGQGVGSLAASASVELADNDRVAIAEGFGNGETEWSFSWFAPDDPQPATLYLALLDGDGASDPIRRFIDPLNDDVITVQVALCPTGMDCKPLAAPDEETSPAGCSAVNPIRTSGVWVILLLALVALRRRSGECLRT